MSGLLNLASNEIVRSEIRVRMGLYMEGAWYGEEKGGACLLCFKRNTLVVYKGGA